MKSRPGISGGFAGSLTIDGWLSTWRAPAPRCVRADAGVVKSGRRGPVAARRPQHQLMRPGAPVLTVEVLAGARDLGLRDPAVGAGARQPGLRARAVDGAVDGQVGDVDPVPAPLARRDLDQ